MKKTFLFFALIIVSFLALAQEKVEMRLDLKNGSTLTGLVTVQQDGSYLLETSTGDMFFFDASEVKRAICIKDQETHIKVVHKKGGNLLFVDTEEKLTETDFATNSGWRQYQKAQKNRKTGNILMITGAGVVAASFALAALFPEALRIDTENASMHVATFSSIAGLATTITGLVFNISGNVKLKKMEDAYNQNPGYVLDFGAQQNGIGFALKF